MRRSRALGYLVGGVLLGVGPSASVARAGSYITHRLAGSPAAGPSTPVVPPVDVPRLVAPRSPAEESLSVRFDPGVADALDAALPRGLPDLPGPAVAGTMPVDAPGTRRPSPLRPNRTVPEPASLVLLVTGLIGLAARRQLLRHRP